MSRAFFFFFFFNDTATTEIYTLSLHDALPICSAAAPPGATPVRIRRRRGYWRPRKPLPGSATACRSSANSWGSRRLRSEEHTSELQSQSNLVCRLLLEKKKQMIIYALSEYA